MIGLEHALVRQKQNLRRQREQASGSKNNAVASNNYTTFKDTLSILEEYGDPELKALAIRVKEDY